MNRYFWILGAFAALVILLAVGLGLNPRDVPSPLVGKPAPAFNLNVLATPDKTLGPKDMQGKVWLLNVWASWCVSCRAEHPVLVEFSKKVDVPLIGLNYKEVRGDGAFDMSKMPAEEEKKLAFQRANKWLADHGDPYKLTVMDLDGRVGIDYGVYGVPETYVIDKAGVMPLAWGENGYREISNSKLAIKKPEDLKGLKIRVVGSPLFLDTFTALGANPTQMSWADAQPALATGAVDGQENPMAIYTAAKLHTMAQKHVTMWGYVSDPLIFVVNKDIWASWTPADRAIVKQAAVDAGKQEIAIARKGLAEADRPLLKEIAGHGVTVTQLSPQEREAFVKATRPVYDKWKNQIGAPLVTAAEKAIAARK